MSIEQESDKAKNTATNEDLLIKPSFESDCQNQQIPESGDHSSIKANHKLSIRER